ncbi:GIY-YIG nuclease family protein [Nodularia chucula]|uniref:GIY-YIG nuclease family protein n=1 Tax=Nodularia chucula TaxID=3093667 RepID=UPI0039C7344E
MYVYLIRDGVTSLYKIGVTQNLEKRLKQLNGNQSPNEKHIVFYIEVINAEPTERILHNKYKKYNHRNEWFYLNDKQVENVIQDMNFMKNNEQILYSGDHEENDEDPKRSDIFKQVLLHAGNLELHDIPDLIIKIIEIAKTKLRDEEEEEYDDKALRFAKLLHILDCVNKGEELGQIDSTTITKAIGLTHYYSNQFVRLYAQHGQGSENSPDITKVLYYVNDQPERKARLADIRRHCFQKKPSEYTRKICDQIVALKKGKISKKGKSWILDLNVPEASQPQLKKF